MTFPTHFSLYIPLLSFSLFLSSSLQPSLYVEGVPVTTVEGLVTEDHSKILSKRLTSLFPHNGTHSITQNTLHVIAAVIGIVGAALLLVGFFIYLKRKRRLKSVPVITVVTKSPSHQFDSVHHHHHHRRMSQFQVFQSDYYHEQSLQQESSTSKLHPPCIDDMIATLPPYKP